jgi:hypothetical protein
MARVGRDRQPAPPWFSRPATNRSAGGDVEIEAAARIRAIG